MGFFFQAILHLLATNFIPVSSDSYNGSGMTLSLNIPTNKDQSDIFCQWMTLTWQANDRYMRFRLGTVSALLGFGLGFY